MAMSLSTSSDVVVKNSIKAVVGPLKDSLRSINRLHKALTDGDVDPDTGQYTNYDYIRGQIERAMQSLKQSDQAASKGLECLDINIEILTRDEGRLDQEMRATQETLDNLRTEQESNETLLQQSENALKLATTNLSSARKALRRQEERTGTATSLIAAGAGVTLIPVVGWFAGPVMAVTGVIEMTQALIAMKQAEVDVQKFKSEVKKYKENLFVYGGKILQTRCIIWLKHDKVEKIREEIRKVNEQRAAVAEFQGKVRRAIHSLSILIGGARVVECQTRRFILQEPVIRVMEDLMTAAGEIAGSQLLADKGIFGHFFSLTPQKLKLLMVFIFILFLLRSIISYFSPIFLAFLVFIIIIIIVIFAIAVVIIITFSSLVSNFKTQLERMTLNTGHHMQEMLCMISITGYKPQVCV